MVNLKNWDWETPEKAIAYGESGRWVVWTDKRPRLD